MLKRLLPHIRQYVGLLGNVSIGVIQLDARGRIMALNDWTLEILNRGDGLSDKGGFVKATAKDEQTALERMLDGALAPEADLREDGAVLASKGGATGAVAHQPTGGSGLSAAAHVFYR